MAGSDDLEAGSRIQVVVRVRPVLPHEISAPVAVSCAPDGRTLQVAHSERETSKPALAASTRPDAKAYMFDACLAGSTTQADLFDTCGIDEMVEAAVDGYCCTVFAFGQTGSGKTYSIMGPGMAGFQEAASSAASSRRTAAVPPTPNTPSSAQAFADAANAKANQKQQQRRSKAGGSSEGGSRPDSSTNTASVRVAAPESNEDEGLLARCVAHLYSSTTARQHACSVRVQASCCEIYNETVTDLLARNKTQQLQVRQGVDEAFYVDGLTHREAPDAARTLLLMGDALSYRHTRAHQLNSASSRSHCLITFSITSQELLPGGLQQGGKGPVRRVGKLVLVDLAGSERLRETGSNAREAVRETGHINKSLFTLGQVLAALSVRGGCGVTGHVPYRESRLTQLLWDGLRGGGRALMLACLSPLKAHAEESLNTLHFASMALRIKSQPVIMMDPQDQVVLEMRDMIKALQEDCRNLAGAITQLTSPGADVGAVLQALPPTLVQDALRYGSSSAPATEQRGSRCGSMKGRRLRASSGDHAKVNGRRTKPSSADALLRHSLPALLSPGKSNSFGSKPRQQQQQQQQQQHWNTSTCVNSIRAGASPPTGMQFLNKMLALSASAGASSSRSSWPTFVTPPHTGGSCRDAGAMHAYPGHGAMGPAAAARDAGSSSGSSAWHSRSRFPGVAGFPAAMDAAGSISPGSYSRGTGSLEPADYGRAGVGGGYLQQQQQQQQLGGVGDFPELAAMEQQFQQLLQQQGPGSGATSPAHAAGAVWGGLSGLATAGGAAASGSAAAAAAGGTPPNSMQYEGTGAAGMLMPSGLPASINQPHTLVPVRMSVTDIETLGTSPEASPVMLAIAAADTHVRPLAVPLRPGERPDGKQQHSQSMPAAGAAAEDHGPEPRALSWAERNSWFGSDTEMTQLAYQVHDVLVEQGTDPASNAYYAAIEQHVAAAFPDKWAQHLAILAALAAKSSGGRGNRRQQQQQQQQGSYTSYRIPLKPSVAAIRGASSGSGVHSSSSSSSPQQRQQQQQQYLRGSLPAQHGSATLGQLLQHPQLAQQQQQQQLWQAAGAGTAQLPGRAFAEEMLQLYNQQSTGATPALTQQGEAIAAASNPQSEQQQQWQRQQQQQQQQQQQRDPGSPQPTHPAAAGLPILQMCASPVPLGAHSPSSSNQQGGLYAGGLDSLSSSIAAGMQGMPGMQARGSDSKSPGASASMLAVPGRLSGGMTAASGQLLASSAARYYDGTGPLTGGAKQSWSTGKYGQGMEAGKCLAEVLRSGACPGNKSLAELQADYRAARGLVLDQLRRQKEDAEQQRKQILMQIGRAINSSKWA